MATNWTDRLCCLALATNNLSLNWKMRRSLLLFVVVAEPQLFAAENAIATVAAVVLDLAACFADSERIFAVERRESWPAGDWAAA